MEAGWEAVEGWRGSEEETEQSPAVAESWSSEAAAGSGLEEAGWGSAAAGWGLEEAGWGLMAADYIRLAVPGAAAVAAVEAGTGREAVDEG